MAQVRVDAGDEMDGTTSGQETTNVNAGGAPSLLDLEAALEAAGIFVATEVRDEAIVLSGEVDSAEMRQAALDLAGAVAGRLGVAVEDAIEVLDVQFDLGSSDAADLGPATVPPGDMMDGVVADVGSIDPGISGEEAVPYFPPTDPVIGRELEDDPDFGIAMPEVIGGFQPTAMDDDAEVDPARIADDERIADDVRAELKADALTTDLLIRVMVRNGVVYLDGDVPSFEDAENAEAVAGRVAGVVEVRERLTYPALRAEHSRD